MEKYIQYFREIFQNERKQIALVLFMLWLYIVSFIVWDPQFSKLLEYVTKLIFMLWMLWVIHLLTEMKKDRWLLIEKLENMDNIVEKLENKIEKMWKQNTVLFWKISGHIELDLQRDKEFINIIKKYDDILEDDIKRYETIMKREEKSKDIYKI